MSKTPSSPPPSNALVADKYRLARLIGRGGMGSVWEARHETLGLRVAIKFIEKEYADSQEARSRFDNEAKAAAKVQSKHLIKIFDHGVTPDGKPYIVMELLEGEPLDKRIERLGRLPLQDVARLIHQVARGLARAHAENIIHRDLKPENIFLTHSTDDDEEIAKVLDFGIAKIRGPGETLSSSTKTGAVLGTPYYMSPEQARGLRDIDHRTDVWSLGVIVFKCVTGVLPFEGESLGDLLVKICTAPLPVPSQVLPGLPQSFDAWFARVLDREPARRFSTVAEMADALAYLCGVSVRRGPTSGATARELQPSHARTLPSAPPPVQAFTPPFASTPRPTIPSSPGTPVPYGAGTRPNVTATGLAASTPRGVKTSPVSLILGIVVGVVATIVLVIAAIRLSPSTEQRMMKAASGRQNHGAVAAASSSAAASEAPAATDAPAAVHAPDPAPSLMPLVESPQGETQAAAKEPAPEKETPAATSKTGSGRTKSGKSGNGKSPSDSADAGASPTTVVKPPPSRPTGKSDDTNPGY